MIVTFKAPSRVTVTPVGASTSVIDSGSPSGSDTPCEASSERLTLSPAYMSSDTFGVPATGAWFTDGRTTSIVTVADTTPPSPSLISNTIGVG